MRTLLVFKTFQRALEVSKEFNINKNKFRYLPSSISDEDILNHGAVRGEMFDRVIYDRRPTSKGMAFLSISMRDGAMITNYNNYKLKRTLEQL